MQIPAELIARLAGQVVQLKPLSQVAQKYKPVAQSTQLEFAHALTRMCSINHHLGNVNHVSIPSIAGLVRGRESA